MEKESFLRMGDSVLRIRILISTDSGLANPTGSEEERVDLTPKPLDWSRYICLRKMREL